MPLTPMAPGGQWLQSPDASIPPVYVGIKQAEAHLKRLFSDGWRPIADPRREEEAAPAPPSAQQLQAASMQARIDQLEEMVRQLLAQKSEATHDSSINHVSSDSQNTADDRRSGKHKPAI